MSVELDNSKVLARLLARLAVALLIGIVAAVVGVVFAMLIVPLFITGWEAFFWVELSALVLGAAGACFGWRWLKKRDQMRGSPI
jgi:uncharacterized membrane protein YfcA